MYVQFRLNSIEIFSRILTKRRISNCVPNSSINWATSEQIIVYVFGRYLQKKVWAISYARL